MKRNRLNLRGKTIHKPNTTVNRLLVQALVSSTLTLALLSPAEPAVASDFIDFFNESAKPWVHRWRAWRADLSITPRVAIPVAGKPPLQASLALPEAALSTPQGVGTVLVLLPYGRTEYGEALRAAIEFGRAGFAVVTVDLRGYETDPPADSDHRRPIPWQGVGPDASAALDWIIQQPWSNGKVGTFGCSALGESQFALARLQHPAHAAMLVSGAGGALGRLNNRTGYFGLFEGGILQLASGYGWLAKRGWLHAPFVRTPFQDPQTPLTELGRLPVTTMIDSPENAWRFFTATPLDDPAWQTMGYVMDGDPLAVPLLTINTWADQTLGESIAVHQYASAPDKRLILGPGGHCNHEQTSPPGGKPEAGWQAVYNDWFSQWLTNPPAPTEPATSRLPAVSYRAPGDTAWRAAGQWPPANAIEQKWRLSTTAGPTNLSLNQDTAARVATASTTHTGWIANPDNPVPSLGGPVCCTNTAVIRSGSVDQAAIEQRDDVLVFTSDAFTEPTLYAGPVSARLFLSSTAVDADMIVRLTDVSPAGVSMNIQEGGQRVSLRKPGGRHWLSPDEIVAVDVTVRPMAHRFETGHRLRVHIAASSFPRLARNLQSGGFNRAASKLTVATHTLHHSDNYPSTLTLTRLP